jgi:hypothetical protein
MRVEVRPVPEGLTTETTPGRKPFSSTAVAAMSSFTVDSVIKRVEKDEQRRLPGIPRPVDPASDLHAQPEAGGRDAGRKKRPTFAVRPP